MQKNYNLPCTGVYKPPGGVEANTAFRSGSKTQACGREPSQTASVLLPSLPRRDIIGAQPFKVCKMFQDSEDWVLQVRRQDTGTDGKAPGVMWCQDPGSQSWTGCSPSRRRGPKRCSTFLMDPGRLPVGGGVESYLGISSSPPIPCLWQEGSLHFQREEEEGPTRCPMSTTAASLATCCQYQLRPWVLPDQPLDPGLRNWLLWAYLGPLQWLACMRAKLLQLCLTL